MSFFHDKITEQIKKQIDSDKKYLFYPNEFVLKDNYYDIYPITHSGSSKYFSNAKEWFSSLLTELKKAKKFIFLQFFSISPGIMWEEIFQVLKERQKSGVEVRMIYDNLVSAAKLPKNFSYQLNEIGIKCQPYYQKSHFVGIINQHYLHRKVGIIDGKIAFTGGINIGDEYLNLISPYGIWQDVGISLTGNSVWNFTVMFLSIWHALSETKEDYWKYYYQVKENTSFSFLAYGDNPLDYSRLSENILCTLIKEATHSISIYTPYFIPTRKLKKAFLQAKRRKVKITVILPGIPDKKLIYFFTKYFANSLKDKYFQVYFYQKGFIHGKVLLIDEKIVSIGNVNLDYYSLKYNFEYNLLTDEKNTIKEILKDIKKIKKHSQKWE